MMPKRVPMIVMGMLCCLAVGAASAGTLYGPTGLVLCPTAYVAPLGAVSIGASTFQVKQAGACSRWESGTVDLGLGLNTEGGVTYLHNSGTQSGGAGAFIKHQFKRETLITPAVAIGVTDIGGSGVKTSEAYLALSKQVVPVTSLNPLTVTAGAVYARDKDGVRRDDWNAFAGFQFHVIPRLALVADWRSKSAGNQKDQSGAMIVYSGHGYNLGVGMVNNGASDSHQLFLNVGFNVNPLH